MSNTNTDCVLQDDILEYFVVQHQCWNGRWYDIDSTKHKTLEAAYKQLDWLSKREYEFVTRFRIVTRTDFPREYLTVGCSQ